MPIRLHRKAPGSVDSGGVGARTRTLHDGVIRIRLDSVCGLVVNAFVLRSAERVVLIDAGFPYTADQLLQGLAEVGLEALDVTDLLVTHLHVDHVGGALTLADRWSPRIWVWSGARPAFGDVNAHLERAQRAPDWPNALIHLETGDATRAERLQAMRAKPLLPLRQPETRPDGTLGDVRPVEHGETITLGPWRFTCMDTRGHGPYHAAWFEAEQGWLFGGDAVLAVPTPLVAAMGDDARAWWRTLDRLGALDVRVLFPGHGGSTTLWAPSLARSKGTFHRVYDATRAALLAGVADPLDAAIRVWPHDRSRFAARTAGALSTSALVLESSVDGGWTRPLGDGRWEPLSPLPEEAVSWVRDAE